MAKNESSDSKMSYKMNNDFIKMKNEIISGGNHKMYEHSEEVAPLNIFKTIAHSDFNKWDINFFIDYITRTHRDMVEKKAVIIYKLAQKVAYKHSEKHPELLALIEVTFLFLHDLLNQMTKEENTVFQHSNQIEKASKRQPPVGNPNSEFLKDKIKFLQDGHENVANYLKAIRKIANNYSIPQDACSSYRSLFEKMKEFEDDVISHFILKKDIV